MKFSLRQCNIKDSHILLFLNLKGNEIILTFLFILKKTKE